MSDKWRDLRVRGLSAVVMLAVAVGAFLAGPGAFQFLIAGVTGVMIWEMCNLLKPRHRALPVVAGVAVTAMFIWIFRLGRADVLESALVLLGLCIFFALLAGRGWWIGFLYGGAVLLSGLWLAAFAALQPGLILMLLGIVILTDIAGYFAGRALGGPKFWPRVSPKKTWSGIVAGWIVAAILAGSLAVNAGLPVTIVLTWSVAAMFLSLASQLGDIAESAIKRRAGVKDASDLIPGHGGFLDRFDGIVGAATLFMVLSLLGTL
ncbi:phosphatidate cytidylyltransferase [Antarctobacter sp.]|uniref:phosphatidate cytidylyltransferase n=1 Tax=Antarctobacter sp. TaxID=1872577 RepID=UPI003A91A23B